MTRNPAAMAVFAAIGVFGGSLLSGSEIKGAVMAGLVVGLVVWGILWALARRGA
jgi:hypothetical protein